MNALNGPSADKKHLILGITISIIASLFYAYDFVIRVMPTVMAHDLMAQYGVDATGFGAISALFFYGYTLMQIPSGVLYDRFSVKWILVIMTALASLSVILFGYTNNIVIASIARFLMGFTSAFAYTGALTVGAIWFAERHFSLFAGLVQVLGSAGAIMGTAPIAYIIAHLGNRQAINAVAVTGFVIVILMVIFVKRGKRPELAQAKKMTHQIRFKQLFGNRQNWWLGLYGFFIWAPISILPSLWGVPFLQQAHGFTHVQAALIVSACWVGIAIAGPILGWWSNHIQLRRLPMIIAASIGLFAAVLIVYARPGNEVIAATLMFLLGTAGSAQVLSFGLAIDQNPRAILSTAIGFTNMSVIAGGMFFQPLVGIILDHYWTGATLYGVRVYNDFAYEYALSIIPISLLGAILTSVFLVKETYCKSQQNT